MQIETLGRSLRETVASVTDEYKFGSTQALIVLVYSIQFSVGVGEAVTGEGKFVCSMSKHCFEGLSATADMLSGL